MPRPRRVGISHLRGHADSAASFSEAARSASRNRALAGLVLGRTSRIVSVADVYPFTAGAVAIGVMLFAVDEWFAGRMAAWIPVAFAVSLAMGAIGTLVSRAALLFVASGVVFGVTFAGMSHSVKYASRS